MLQFVKVFPVHLWYLHLSFSIFFVLPLGNGVKKHGGYRRELYTWRFRILSKWIETRVITPISGEKMYPIPRVINLHY